MADEPQDNKPSAEEARLVRWLRENPPHKRKPPPAKPFLGRSRESVERGLAAARQVAGDDEPAEPEPAIPPELAGKIAGWVREELGRVGDRAADRYRGVASEVFVTAATSPQFAGVPPRTLFLAIGDAVLRVHEERAAASAAETVVDSARAKALTTLADVRENPAACKAQFARLRGLAETKPAAFEAYVLHYFAGREEPELAGWDGARVYESLVTAEKEVTGRAG